MLGENFSESADVLDGDGFSLIGDGDFGEMREGREVTLGTLF